jgi:MarR family transcriptional regulator, organic hydroperoxide resistance regulator
MEKAELIKELLELGDLVDRETRPLDAEPWIELKMTIAQLKSMFFIAAKGKTNFKKLADALGVTPPNITGIIDRLVEQGLVSRTENAEDRRIMLLQVTEKGQELVDNLQENKYHKMRNLMTNMSEDELKAMMTGLKGILKAAKAISKEVSGLNKE